MAGAAARRRRSRCVGAGAARSCCSCSTSALGDFEIPFGARRRAPCSAAATPAQQFIINELRLPQTTVAVLVGAALGLAGALTQTFARNPLASPDILGVTEGASVGAVARDRAHRRQRATAAAWSPAPCRRVGLPLAAFAGGLLTAALLYVLSWRRGIDGQRLVLIGIGLGAALTAVTRGCWSRARIQDAAERPGLAQRLAQRPRLGPGHARCSCTLAVLVPVALLLVRHLNALQLGDDSARGLGVRLQTDPAADPASPRSAWPRSRSRRSGRSGSSRSSCRRSRCG